MDYGFLINKALEARKNAFAPYSNYAVGAAILCDDDAVYQGANIENASYGGTICAERVALFKAVFEGKRHFKAIVIAGGSMNEEDITSYAFPCGICRQVMSEFFDADTMVIVAKSNDDYKEYRFEEIMPYTFKLDE